MGQNRKGKGKGVAMADVFSFLRRVSTQGGKGRVIQRIHQKKKADKEEKQDIKNGQGKGEVSVIRP